MKGCLKCLKLWFPKSVFSSALYMVKYVTLPPGTPLIMPRENFFCRATSFMNIFLKIWGKWCLGETCEDPKMLIIICIKKRKKILKFRQGWEPKTFESYRCSINNWSTGRFENRNLGRFYGRYWCKISKLNIIHDMAAVDRVSWYWPIGLCLLATVAVIPVVRDLQEHIVLLLCGCLLPSHQQRAVREGKPLQFSSLT